MGSLDPPLRERGCLVIYIHLERSGVCIAILLKPHTALRRLTGSPKNSKAIF